MTVLSNIVERLFVFGKIPSELVVWVFVVGADCDARSCFGCGCKIILPIIIIIIIIDNFCIPLFSGVHKLTALYNTLQHFLSK